MNNRVTMADIEAEIASEHYFTAHDAAIGQHTTEGGPVAVMHPNSHANAIHAGEALRLLTFCVLVLRNGFTVTGESACVSPENFDAEIGRKIAREKAIDKLWPLLGFRLRDRIETKRQFPDGKPCTCGPLDGCASCTRPVLTEADAAADLAGTPRPDWPFQVREVPTRPVVAQRVAPETPAIIKPTIGRKVWFYPGGRTFPRVLVQHSPDPLDATIVHVWHDRMVNLAVMDHAGNHHRVNFVHLVQPEDEFAPPCRAEWMPYQVKQAAGA